MIAALVTIATIFAVFYALYGIMCIRDTYNENTRLKTELAPKNEEVRRCHAEVLETKRECSLTIQKERTDCRNEIADARKRYEEKISKKEQDFKYRLSIYKKRQPYLSSKCREDQKIASDLLQIDRAFVKIRKKEDELELREHYLGIAAQMRKAIDLEAAVREEIDRMQKKVSEDRKKVSDDQKDCELLLDTIQNNSSNAYPPLAKAIANYATRKIAAYEMVLRIKKRPAYKQANMLKDAKDALKEFIQKYNEEKYLRESYEALFPWIEEFREYDPDEIQETPAPCADDRDPVRNYLTDAEYSKLSVEERNQKALERYIQSHKSKSQIGRLYERFVGYEYERRGYTVPFHGAIKGFEDLGRDIIAQNSKEILIIQCKNWSKDKLIRENAICQLYGTGIKYQIEHRGEQRRIISVMVTSTVCSEMARAFASALGVMIYEDKPLRDYPMVKCNIGRNGDKIYHLPMDQQYDTVRIEPKKGEFYASSCEEAADRGFRRAYKWHGEDA